MCTVYALYVSVYRGTYLETIGCYCMSFPVVLHLSFWDMVSVPGLAALSRMAGQWAPEILFYPSQHCATTGAGVWTHSLMLMQQVRYWWCCLCIPLILFFDAVKILEKSITMEVIFNLIKVVWLKHLVLCGSEHELSNE